MNLFILLAGFMENRDPVQLIYLLAVLAALIVMRRYGGNRNRK